LAGVWQMGSPVAVEMVNLPTTFLAVLLNMNLFVRLKVFVVDCLPLFCFFAKRALFFFFFGYSVQQIAPLLTFACVKTCFKDSAIKEDGKIDKDVAMNLYGKLCLFLSFFTWVFICIWMMANRFSNVLGTKFRFGDILLGVSLPFDVPSLQLPTVCASWLVVVVVVFFFLPLFLHLLLFLHLPLFCTYWVPYTSIGNIFLHFWVHKNLDSFWQSC